MFLLLSIRPPKHDEILRGGGTGVRSPSLSLSLFPTCSLSLPPKCKQTKNRIKKQHESTTKHTHTHTKQRSKQKTKTLNQNTSQTTYCICAKSIRMCEQKPEPSNHHSRATYIKQESKSRNNGRTTKAKHMRNQHTQRQPTRGVRTRNHQIIIREKKKESLST